MARNVAHRSTAPHPNQQSLRAQQPHVEKGTGYFSKSCLSPFLVIAYGMASGRLADILLPSTPTLGDPKASVLMIEFSDFTCGYCGRFYRETLPALKAEYLGAGKVRFAYRDYPRDPEGWGLVAAHAARSEEHTSELQSLAYLVCRLLLEKKKKSYKLIQCNIIQSRSH